MLAYLNPIVMRYAPSSCVEDESYRNFSKFDYNFSRKTVKEVLFSVAEKLRTAFHLKWNPQKARLCTMNGFHCVGLFAIYIRELRGVQKVTALLLSMILMNAHFKCEDSNDCSCASATADFNAGTHAEHIRNVFGLYSIDFVLLWRSSRFSILAAHP